MGDLVVGVDVGTHKICTLVGEVRPNDIFVVGLGIEGSAGMKKGVVSDVGALSKAIANSIRKAEKSSGYDINRAFVSVAGNHISSLTSRGITTIVGHHSVQEEDLNKAMGVARVIAIPHNREVLHVVPRSYTLDGQDGIRSPIGMHCFRLEVDAHIITASTTSLANLEDAVESAGVLVDRFILNPLAAGDAVLTSQEREMGAVVIDIGGGTTDLAIFIAGTVWHTAIIPVGGNHVTDDITYWMRVPFSLAENVKIQQGHADRLAVSETEEFSVEPFGGESLQVSQRDLALVIEARFEEIFDLAQKEIQRSGYAGLLRAGAVITGGSSQMPGCQELAARVLDMPIRLAQPEKLSGIADALKSPAYSTSVGLLRVGLDMDTIVESEPSSKAESPGAGLVQRINDFLRRFLPENDWRKTKL